MIDDATENPEHLMTVFWSTLEYCPYPGNLMYGEIRLVGVMGKYRYESYINHIGHNDKIEYECQKHYKLHGPRAATCVDGQWSPSEKPKCLQGTSQRALDIGTTSISSLEQRNNLISINFRRCSNNHVPAGTPFL